MIETQLNIFDAVVIGVMVLSCLFAFFRGLVREILSLIGWIGTAIVTAHYFKPVAEKLAPHFREPHIATGMAIAGLVIVSLIGFAILNMIIVKTIKGGEKGGMLDNMLGLCFGAFRGAFILSLGYFLITPMLPEDDEPKWLAQSTSRPYVERGSVILAKAAPEFLDEISSLQKKAVDYAEKQKNNRINERSNEERYGDSEPSYRKETTRELDRMIESSGPAR